MSLPELLLWRALLAIEVDGEAHNRADRPEHDAARDAWLGEQGVSVLRIPATEVLGDLDAVPRYVIHNVERRLPLHRPSDGPPPRAGLGED